jgi:hypothetical protein
MESLFLLFHLDWPYFKPLADLLLGVGLTDLILSVRGIDCATGQTHRAAAAGPTAPPSLKFISR